jgi:hypothetical protein
MKLTIKQEKAAIKYVECGNMSEAYRYAYNTVNMKPETINRCAKELFDKGKITARVEALQARLLARHDITVDSLTVELEDARKLAMETNNPSAAVAAITGKAKLHGLLIERRQLEQVNSGLSDSYSDDELAAMLKERGEITEH